MLVPLTNTFRVRPRLAAAAVVDAAAAAASVADGDGCYCCCRKTSGPGRYPGGRLARSKKVQSCKCKLVAPAAVGDGAAAAAVGSAGVMIVVEVCSGLFGRSVEPRSHCFAFGDLDLSSGSWTYW